MKTPDVMALIEFTSDADLVTACLAGNRSAFRQIVERYQSLLCSLAYSATGDLNASEDAAQETFVTAWTKLGQLRDPAKLRSWLCTTLRHKVSHARRSNGREPVRGADELTEAREVPAPESAANDEAIDREEQAILWRSLAQLPPNYREPLILYYREHQSIEHVAVELDLTEDAVKQRLSRGRKLLKEHALAFVEGALSRSTPGKLFTLGVLAALPAFSPPAQAAGIGAAAVAASKGVGGIAKTTLLATVLASISGLISAVMTLRMNLDQSRTKLERSNVVRTTVILLGSALAFFALLFATRAIAILYPEQLVNIIIGNHVLIVAFIIGWPWLFIRSLRQTRELRTRERLNDPDKFNAPVDRSGSNASEYRSKATFLGVPLVHIRFSMEDSGQKPTFGWIAGGDRAIGLLFAWGGWAVGCFSIGAVSFGLFSFGAVSVGLISIGAVALGGIALGSVSIGIHAIGSISATAWHIAQGPVFAVSNWVANAPLALAPHINDATAQAVLANPHADRDWMIFCIIVVFLSLVPTTAYAKAVRHRMKLKR